MDKSEFRLIRALAFLIRVGSNNYWLINNSLIAIVLIITIIAFLENTIGVIASLTIAIVLVIIIFTVLIILMSKSKTDISEDSGKIE